MRLALMLVILFEMIVLPVQNAYACSYPNDPQLQKAKDDCTSSAKQWSCSQNRCMTTQESLSDRKDFEKCTEIEDPDKKQACMNKIAQQESGVRAGEGKDDFDTQEDVEILAMVITGIYALLGLIAMAAKKPATCTSKNIMMLGAVAHLLTHFFMVRDAKKNFKEMYKEVNQMRADRSGSDHDAQMRAFDVLEKEQGAIEKYAKKRKDVYTIILAIFAVAAVVAICEMIPVCPLTDCAGDDKPADGDKAADGADAPAEGADAPAEGADTPAEGADTPAEGADQPADASTEADFTESLGAGSALITMSSSLLVMIWALVAVGLSIYLRQAAEKQEKDASSNKKKIQQVKAKFQDSIAGFCSDRTDMSNPSCYCMTKDGKENSNRSKSQVCQDYWSSRNQNYAVKATNYGGKKEPRKGCLTVYRQFDENCECRKYQDKTTGQNGCFKGEIVGIPGTLAGNLSLGDPLNGFNTLTGSNNSATLNSETLKTAALRNKRFMDAFITDYNKKNKSNPIKTYSARELAQIVKQKVTPELEKKFSGGMLGAIAGENRPATGDLASALDKAEKSANIEKSSLSFSGGKGVRRKKAEKKGFSFNFNDDSGSGGKGNVLNLPGEEEKKYKINDINNRDDMNIFDIITNRYRQSAYRSLFEEDEKK